MRDRNVEQQCGMGMRNRNAEQECRTGMWNNQNSAVPHCVKLVVDQVQ